MTDQADADFQEKWASAAVGIDPGLTHPCHLCQRSIYPMTRHWVVRLGADVQVRHSGGQRFEMRMPDVILRVCMNHEPPQLGAGPRAVGPG